MYPSSYHVFLLTLAFMLFSIPFQLNGKEEDDTKKEEEKPPAIGNFALPTSQQPAALFGFGGNIIDKGEIQTYLFYDDFEGKCKALIEPIPSVQYGITDAFSVALIYPFAALSQDGPDRSSGLEDFLLQFEYAYYTKGTSRYVDQATILWSFTFPTGSVYKNPPTGLGAPALFIGGTYYRTWIDWFIFTDQGVLLTTSHRGTKFGNQFLYQFGIGKNIPSPKGYIYAWMVELDGQYGEKNRIFGKIDPNSGGNVIYVTPSIWVSSRTFLVQLGFSFPVHRHLFGKQRKFNYALNFNCAWSFYEIKG